MNAKRLLFESLEDFGLSTMRENVERIVGRADPAILFRDKGLMTKVSNLIVAEPTKTAMALDALSSFLGKYISRKHPTAGKVVDELGDGIAHGLKALAEKAKKGKQVTANQVQEAMLSTSEKLARFEALASSQFEMLSPGQRAVFAGLLSAALDEQAYDRTEAWANDQHHQALVRRGLSGFCGLAGKAFRLEQGLWDLLERDTALLQRILPRNLKYEDVRSDPVGTCGPAIDVIITHERMLVAKILDFVDLSINKEEVSNSVRTGIGQGSAFVRRWFGRGITAYIVLLLGGLSLFAVSAVAFLSAHATILFFEGQTASAVIMGLAFLGFLLFRYTFSSVDAVHGLVSRIARQLRVDDPSSVVKPWVDQVFILMGKQPISPAQGQANTRKESQWATHFGGTALIAATIMSVFTIVFILFDDSRELGALILLAELGILLAAEVARRTSHHQEAEFAQKTSQWLNRWILRVAVAMIVVVLFVLGGTKLMQEVEIDFRKSEKSPPTTQTAQVGASPTQEACEYFHKYDPTNLPTACAP